MKYSSLILVLLLLCSPATTAFADTETIYESASFVATDPSDPANAISSFTQDIIGVRFEVFATKTATTIGGHFRGNVAGPENVYAALVELASATAFPDLSDPTSIVADSLLVVPGPDINNVPFSGDVAVNFAAPVTLNPGTFYALVFGSGFNGAGIIGVGVPRDNTEIQRNYDSSLVDPPYFVRQVLPSPTYLDQSNLQTRFFLTQVPEPASILLAILAAAGAMVLVRRSRQRPV